MSLIRPEKTDPGSPAMVEGNDQLPSLPGNMVQGDFIPALPHASADVVGHPFPSMANLNRINDYWKSFAHLYMNHQAPRTGTGRWAMIPSPEYLGAVVPFGKVAQTGRSSGVDF
ncbi:MAG: hypothetical protein WBG37_20640 [Desulfobacterales bacterium]